MSQISASLVKELRERTMKNVKLFAELSPESLAKLGAA